MTDIRRSALGTTALAMLAAGVLAIGSTAALAQQAAPPAGQPQQAPPPQAQPMPGQEAPQASFSDEEIETYADATLEVQEIGAKWEPRLLEAQQAQQPEQLEQLQREAEEEMVDAVQSAGLSVEQYNEITRMAQVDQNLRDRILGQMENR